MSTMGPPSLLQQTGKETLFIELLSDGFNIQYCLQTEILAGK